MRSTTQPLRPITSALALGIVAVAAIVALAPRSTAEERLGDHLKKSRKATGLSLRGVEAQTQITNGYLSQIESNAVDRPSPNVLYKLSDVYGIDYSDLMRRAGHHVPNDGDAVRPSALAGIPLRALEELTEDEAAELRNYLAFIRQKRGDQR
ncbi:helix-turn-helix domain-containing protein [Microbacterium sp. SSM24]|uniref:helix-turn-helix domain-containing protein n=1 Tax=Microbacterium sp. SSM24 TaxID=2991714 RepID=UPI002225E886|nr:helix-turn-helix transcriptional regulator [Microbacterium sp. SSM24]MCW3492029.1 helix-turn-helix domain-containing protein [Microbacterium sp. SSM24]